MENSDLSPLKYLITRTFEELPDGTELKYIDAQKIFYLTQKRLEPDNRVAQLLPYYWYIHGPMSKRVSYTLNAAKNDGVLDGQTTDTGGQVYTIGESDPPSVDSDEDLERAETVIREVLSEYDVFSNLDERLREDIYVDAPYEFQSYYKFEVLPVIEEFVREPYFLVSPPEEIKFRLARAEAKVPIDPGFSEWRERFSRFVTLAELYLEEVDESEKQAAETFGQLANDAWKLFAKQLRIQEHDDDYEDELKSWQLEYDESLRSFDDSLRRFEETLEEQFDPYGGVADGSESVRLDEDSGWGTVAASLLQEPDHD